MKHLKYLLVLILCLVLTVGMASALDDLLFRDAKQDLMKYHGSGSLPSGKPFPGKGPVNPFFYVGQLPFIVRAGDDLNIKVYGDMVKGQSWSIQILNAWFTTSGGEFTFNVSDVTVPADSEHVNLSISAVPVSFLRLEYHEEGVLRSLESSSPDQTGMISLDADNADEEQELKEFIVIRGTPTATSITMNEVIEGVLSEDVSNPTIPFHIEELQRGSFTIVVSVDGREKLRQYIYAL